MVGLGRGSRRGRLLLPLLLVLAAALTSSHLASAQRAETTSPASGHGEVIAQGVATMPKVPVGWRVLQIDAKPIEDAPVAERSLGFVLAGEGDVLVTAEAGEQTLLAPGEALLTLQGAKEQRASTSNKPVSYYALELVVAPDLENQATIGSGELLFAGEAFTAPKGDRDLNLVRDVLDKGEATEIFGAQGPVLILVTSGEVEVSGDDDDATLQAGEAAVLSGDLSFRATRNGSTFVAATIGAQMPSAPRQATARPTAQPAASGKFSVTTYACPAGTSIETLDTDACAVSDDSLIAWSLVGDDPDETIGEEDVETDGPTTTWTGLPAGTYFLHLSAESFASGYSDYFIPSSDQVTREDENTTKLYYDSAKSTGSVRAYVFGPGDTTSSGPVSISVEIHNCPAGTPLENIQVEPCTEPLGQTGILLGGSGIGLPLSLVEASGDEPAPTWTNLPFGDYCLMVSNMENGHDAIYIFGTHASATYSELNENGTAVACWAMVDGGSTSDYVYLYIVDSTGSDAPPVDDVDEDADSDGDGIADFDEITYGTDPDSADTDGDGVDDAWEFEYETDPTDPSDYPVG